MKTKVLAKCLMETLTADNSKPKVIKNRKIKVTGPRSMMSVQLNFIDSRERLQFLDHNEGVGMWREKKVIKTGKNLSKSNRRLILLYNLKWLNKSMTEENKIIK